MGGISQGPFQGQEAGKRQRWELNLHPWPTGQPPTLLAPGLSCEPAVCLGHMPRTPGGLTTAPLGAGCLPPSQGQRHLAHTERALPTRAPDVPRGEGDKLPPLESRQATPCDSGGQVTNDESISAWLSWDAAPLKQPLCCEGAQAGLAEGSYRPSTQPSTPVWPQFQHL